MSADRENHEMTDMTHTDIALLLADAADEVDIGTAPVQAVIRGGRRRRTRRWAVTAATALVLAGSTGATLAVAGLPGAAHGTRQSDMPADPADPATPEARHVYAPQTTDLARGLYRGKEWRVALQVWGAPRNRTEADRQYAAMARLGMKPPVDKPAGLVGKISDFVTRAWGDHRPQQVMFDTMPEWEPMRGTDLEAIATRLGWTPESSERLVIGDVARTTARVKCTWNDGTSTVEVSRAGVGSPVNWFVCVAPEGKRYKNAEVIR